MMRRTSLVAALIVVAAIGAALVWTVNAASHRVREFAVAVVKGDELHGMLFFHQGDDSGFVAKKKSKR